MAISFIGSEYAAGTGFYDVTVDVPSGTAENDLMIAMIDCLFLNSSPAGWTEIGNRGGMYIYRKVASASEPSSYTWSTSSSGANDFGVIGTYRQQLDPSDPIYDLNVEVWDNPSGPGYSINAGSVDVSFNNSAMIFLYAGADGGTEANISVPTNPFTFTVDFDHYASGDGNGKFYMASGHWPSSGTSGDVIATADDYQYGGAVAAILVVNSVVPYDAGTGQSVSATTGSGSWTLTRAYPAGPGQSVGVTTGAGSWIQYIPVDYDAGTGQSVAATTGSGTWTKTWFYASSSGQSVEVTIPTTPGYWTYPKPTVTLSNSTWHDKHVNIYSIGKDYGLTGVTVELCNNSDYSLATIKDSQTILYSDDEKVTLLCDTSSFSDGDTAYLFITNKYGSRSLYAEVDIIDYEAPTLPNRWRLDAIYFLKDAYATYNCTVFGDDRDGNYLWEKIDSDKDLVLGDGSTASTFPAHTENTDGKDYYTFDGIDDHLSSWPTMPTVHTTIMAYSESPHMSPTYLAVNDDEVEDLLTTPGAFAGRLYGLIIFDWALSALEISYVTDRMLRLL